MPFEPRLIWEFDNGGYMWFVESDRYTVVKTDLSGDTLLIIERAHEPYPIDTRARAEARAYLDRAANRAGRAQIDLSGLPTHKPAIYDLLVDDQGRLWVQLFAADSSAHFDIFDDQGILLATAVADFAIPWYPDAQVANGKLYAVVRDSLDVQYVVQAGITN